MERVDYRPEHYVEMENKLREYLLERLSERKALGDKVIRSRKTVRTYLALLRRLLSPDPKYYPNYSEGVEKYGDIKFPLTCGDVVKIILDMYEKKGYSYYQEVKFFTRQIDLIAIKTKEIIAIEVKVENWQKALFVFDEKHHFHQLLCTPYI